MLETLLLVMAQYGHAQSFLGTSGIPCTIAAVRRRTSTSVCAHRQCNNEVWVDGAKANGAGTAVTGTACAMGTVEGSFSMRLSRAVCAWSSRQSWSLMEASSTSSACARQHNCVFAVVLCASIRVAKAVDNKDRRIHCLDESSFTSLYKCRSDAGESHQALGRGGRVMFRQSTSVSKVR